MVEYVAFEEGVEISGFGMSMLFEDIEPMLQEAGLLPFDDEAWLPQQAFLDVLREVNQRDIVLLGMKVADIALMALEANTLEDALSNLDALFQSYHRGGDAGGFHFVSSGSRQGKMIACNAYPSDFDFGLIYRLLQKLRSDSRYPLHVELDDSKPNRKTGGNCCTFLLRW